MSSEDDYIESLVREAEAEIELEREVLESSTIQSPVQRFIKRARPSIAARTLLEDPTLARNAAEQPAPCPTDAETADLADKQVADQQWTDEINRQFHDLPSQWAERCKKKHIATCSNRPYYFQAALCTGAVPAAGSNCDVCNERQAVLRCLDCFFSAKRLLCGDCDVAAHPYAHFHRRQSFSEGYWKPLPPLLSITQDGQPFAQGMPTAVVLLQQGMCRAAMCWISVLTCVCAELCFNIRPLQCLTCGSRRFSAPVAAAGEKLTYILHGRAVLQLYDCGYALQQVQGRCHLIVHTLAGRHEFCRGYSTCLQCDGCYRANVLDFIALGAWPCSPNVELCSTFVDERVLQHYAAAKHTSPALSTHAFLRALALTSMAYGGNVGCPSLLWFDLYKMQLHFLLKCQDASNETFCDACAGAVNQSGQLHRLLLGMALQRGGHAPEAAGN